MEKVCKKCNCQKGIEEFYTDKRNKKDGRMGVCKLCYDLRIKNWNTDNKDKRNSTVKQYNDKTKDYRKSYYESNKDIIIERTRTRYFNVVKPNITELDREKNRVRIAEYRKNNPEKIKIQRQNPERKKVLNEWEKNKRKTDELYKLKGNIRSLIRMSLKSRGIKKNTKTVQILGCTFEYFKKHLESQFEPWMNWNNYGLYNGTPNFGWDIDHIIPNSLSKTADDVIKLNHYTNLQPLCSHINRDVKKNFLL